jgi:hypothetical protein
MAHAFSMYEKGKTLSSVYSFFYHIVITHLLIKWNQKYI